MVAASARHGVKLGVTMLALGDPVHHDVRTMIAGGWLGQPVLVQRPVVVVGLVGVDEPVGLAAEGV